MELFVNDLSLHAQFQAPSTFRPALQELLHCHTCARSFNRAFYVPRSISSRMVGANTTFQQAVRGMGDMNLTRLVMGWIDRQGPFVDDVLTRDEGEYYWFRDEDHIVTAEVLGEVAARHFAERPAGLVSIAPSDFTQSPLTVVWHRADDKQERGDLDNFWDRTQLESYLEQHESDVQNWSEMLSRARTRYTNLAFFDGMEEHLAGEPFSTTIAQRVFFLLDILNRLKTSYTSTGERTKEGEDLTENFFRRGNFFSDASDTEKNTDVFRKAMTFQLPTGEPLECFWHGKITHRFFRIHFSPITPDQPLYIAYIGPKLTRQ